MIETLLTQVRDHETRQVLGECVVALFRRWSLDDIDQAALLGMRASAPLHNGEAVPDDPLVLARVGHLLAIDRALHALYRYAPRERDGWVTSSDPHLDGRTPLSIMLDHGLAGIVAVREQLDAAVTALNKG